MTNTILMLTNLLSSTTLRLSQKKTSDLISSIYLQLAYTQFISALFAYVIKVYVTDSFALNLIFDLKGISYLVLSSIFFFSGLFLLYKSYQTMSSSVVNILFSLNIVFLYIGSIILFDNTLNLKSVAGIGLILLGTTLVSIVKKQRLTTTLIPIMAGLVFAAALLTEGLAVGYHGSGVEYAPVNLFLTGLLALIPGLVNKEKVEMTTINISFLLLAGFALAISVASITTAINQGLNPGVAYPISMVAQSLAAIGSIYVFKEKDLIYYKYIAAIIAVFGAMLLY